MVTIRCEDTVDSSLAVCLCASMLQRCRACVDTDIHLHVAQTLRVLQVLNIVSIGWQIFYLMLLRPDTVGKEKDIEEGGLHCCLPMHSMHHSCAGCWALIDASVRAVRGFIG